MSRAQQLTAEPFKPGYDGDRPPSRTTAPERQTLRLEKPALVARIHRAMLTLAINGSTVALGIKTGGTPQHIVEFADRVGEEQQDAPMPRFAPKPADVSDMLGALDLLQGLRPAFFKVVFLRALHDFQEEEGARGQWPWAKIGAFFSMSEAWAQNAYDQAIVQAARRAGVLPMMPTDHAILIASTYLAPSGWLTQISGAQEPRQALSNLRSKNAVRIEQATCLWVAGEPVAKRVLDQSKAAMRALLDHGAWYKAHPDRVCEQLVLAAQAVPSVWTIEDIPCRLAA
jgi:hypothetical protein